MLFFILLTFVVFSQNKSNSWDKLTPLIGEWVGEGSGEPGQGEGAFTFLLDLDKNILVRKSFSKYPATNDKPAVNHEDLMIIYPGSNNDSYNAIYFDNEGHVIHYVVGINEKKIVFTSEKTTGDPVFRLSYSFIDSLTVNIKFEMSQDGDKFFTYVEGKSKKQK